MCPEGPISSQKNPVVLHQVEFHDRPQPLEYICDMCSKVFHKKSNLLLHLNNHVNPRNYACDVCDARFNSQQSLTKHKTFHISLRCNLCNIEFTLRNDYRKHHKDAHKGELKTYQVIEETDESIVITNTTQEPKPSNDNIRYECQGCHKEYKSSKGFKEHICQELKAAGLDSTPSACSACGKMFNSKVWNFSFTITRFRSLTRFRD